MAHAPMPLYNVPGRTAVHLALKTIAEVKLKLRVFKQVIQG
jgi:dihydrodipicolinate synthase/N-acetylneuraminate lyase